MKAKSTLIEKLFDGGVALAKKKKFDIERVPLKPKASWDPKFEWIPRPTPIPIPVNYVQKYDLEFKVSYSVSCPEEEVKDDEFDFSKIVQIEYVSILAPSDWGGSLFFKTWNDGQWEDPEYPKDGYIKSFNGAYQQHISTQERWGSSPKVVKLTFVCRSQFFSRIKDLKDIDTSVFPPEQYVYRQRRRTLIESEFMIPAPPQSVPTDHPLPS